MLNEIIKIINTRLVGFTKAFCLVEWRDKPKEYTKTGNLRDISYDKYPVGGYWRLRGQVSSRYENGNAVCVRRRLDTIPLYFVAWAKHSEREPYGFSESVRKMIEKTQKGLRVSIISTNIDALNTEFGVDKDDWFAVRFEIDVEVDYSCVDQCTTDDECAALLQAISKTDMSGCLIPGQTAATIVTGVNNAPTSVYDAVIAALCGSGTEYDLSIPQAPLTLDVDANKTLYIRAEDGDDFGGPLISAVESTNDVYVTLANYFMQVIGTSGQTTAGIQRGTDPRVILVDSGAAALPNPTISQSGGDNQNVTLTFGDITVQVNGSNEDVIALSETIYNIILRDPSAATVTPDSIDAATDGEITIDLPYIPLAVSIAVDDETPTVADEIESTVTAAGADSFCVSFGDGTSVAGTSNTANKTYMIPGVYTVGALAGINATGVGGGVPDADKVDVTVSGLLDTYATDAFIGSAPVLLQRLYAGDGVEIRRTSTPGTQDFGYTDGIEDSFLAYCGAGDGFVRTLYNQVGNSFQQTTDALQPQVVDAGVLNVNPYGGYVMQFNDNEYLQATRENFWGADRTKLFMAFAFGCDGGAALSTNHLICQWQTTTNQRGWRAYYDDSSENIGCSYTTDGTNSTLQQITFSGISLNEFVVCILQIDTDESVNDRIQAWKYDANGETALTRTGTTGNFTGNLHNSTADFAIGAANIATTPAALLSGSLSPHFIVTPQLISDANRATIGNYLLSCISDAL